MIFISTPVEQMRKSSPFDRTSRLTSTEFSCASSGGAVNASPAFLSSWVRRRHVEDFHDLQSRSMFQRIKNRLRLPTSRHQTRLTQNTQMLRKCRLAKGHPIVDAPNRQRSIQETAQHHESLVVRQGFEECSRFARVLGHSRHRWQYCLLYLSSRQFCSYAFDLPIYVCTH